MDPFQGITTSLVVAAMSEKQRNRRQQKFDAGYVQELLDVGGENAALAQQWLDGAEMVARGRGLKGWFVGPKQNREVVPPFRTVLQLF